MFCYSYFKINFKQGDDATKTQGATDGEREETKTDAQK